MQPLWNSAVRCNQSRHQPELMCPEPEARSRPLGVAPDLQEAAVGPKDLPASVADGETRTSRPPLRCCIILPRRSVAIAKLTAASIMGIHRLPWAIRTLGWRLGKGRGLMYKYHHNEGGSFILLFSSMAIKTKYIIPLLCTFFAISGCQTSSTVNHNLSAVKYDPKSKTNISYNFGSATNWNPYLGNSSHICSPSGFGRQSHCFLRI